MSNLCFHSDDIALSFSGPFNEPQDTLLKLRKHLDVVTLHMPLVIGAPGVSQTTQAISVDPLPEEYRPSIEVNAPVSIILNDTYQDLPGEIRIRTTGFIEISAACGNNTVFGLTDRNGWKSISVSYVSSL